MEQEEARQLVQEDGVSSTHDLLCREAAEKEFEELCQMFATEESSLPILNGGYFEEMTELSVITLNERKESTKKDNGSRRSNENGVKKANNSRPTAAAIKIEKDGPSEASKRRKVNHPTVSTNSAALILNPVPLSLPAPLPAKLELYKEGVRAICKALMDSDEEERERVICQYAAENMIYYACNGNNLPRNMVIKDILLRDRATFLAYWSSRLVSMPDMILKYHFPMKYQQREDGGVTIFVNVLGRATKIMESKDVLDSKNIGHAGLGNITVYESRTQHHNQDILTVKNSMSSAVVGNDVAKRVVDMLSGTVKLPLSTVVSSSSSSSTFASTATDNSETSEGPLSFSSSFSSSARKGMFQETYLMAKPVVADSCFTFSFHFDVNTDKMSQFYMLRSAVLSPQGYLSYPGGGREM